MVTKKKLSWKKLIGNIDIENNYDDVIMNHISISMMKQLVTDERVTSANELDLEGILDTFKTGIEFGGQLDDYGKCLYINKLTFPKGSKAKLYDVCNLICQCGCPEMEENDDGSFSLLWD